MSGPGPIAHSAPLPIEASVDVALPVERLWEIFVDVPRWPDWNPCFWRSSVGAACCASGRHCASPSTRSRRATPQAPGSAETAELEPHDRATWEVSAPGFHALHSYRFAALDAEHCRFGSWEVAEGPTYRALRRFWLAHFRYVCRESLAGARALSA